MGGPKRALPLVPLSLIPRTYLVLEARLEVAQEGGRLEALDLTVLHSPAIQVVIQLHGEDGGSPALVLAALIAWGAPEQCEPGFPKSGPKLPRKKSPEPPSLAWLEKLGKPLPSVGLS